MLKQCRGRFKTCPYELELEILDASRVIERKDVEVAVEELVTKAR